ncbi:MAG: ABC transporter ATP-binding protein [Phycicoccus sp.]|nr:ABC transporter ATP-binding protein [Phycicoccus sp.]
MSDILTIAEATKTFGEHVALDGVSLTLQPGECLGLLGPNGAGKSTLISLAIGLRKPDRGTVDLFGLPPTSPEARLRLGVTPQSTGVPTTLKAREVLEFVAAHYPDPLDVGQLIEDFGLGDVADVQCGGLSGGQQRRLLVALSFVGRPDLIVFDEPTTGLDVESRERLWAAIRAYRTGGGTVLLTSHYLAEIEALASRVVVIDNGRTLAQGSVADITARVGLRRLRLTTDANAEVLASLPGVVDLSVEGTRTTLSTRDADAAVRELCGRGIAFRDLEVHQASLEEAFLALTSHAA